MMLLLNTRPTQRAATLSQRLNRAGIEVVELPLLELTGLPYSAELAALYARLADTQVIVVVRPTAVDVGMQYLQVSQIEMSSLAHIQWIAVGQATAQRLKDYGISASIPDVETSEGMLALPVLQNLAVKQVAFWRGRGGRQFMMDALQQRGVKVQNFLLYQRQCPEQAHIQFEQFQSRFRHQHQSVWVCISSEASWLNWLKLCQNSPDILSQCQYLTLGTRLTTLVRQQQMPLVTHQLDDLDPEQICHFLIQHKGSA